MLMLAATAVASADRPAERPAGGPTPLTEAAFRAGLGVPAHMRLSYRDLSCKTVSFQRFAEQMSTPGAHADMAREPDGKAATITVEKRGVTACPRPYPPITHLPRLDAPDLDGRRVTSASLAGKPTVVSFFFAACVPCILEVGPLNSFAAHNPHLNSLAVTFDEPAEARAFVTRYGFQWRVVPDEQDFIERVGVPNYPLIALFDARGRLLGMKVGGVTAQKDVPDVEPQLQGWVDELLSRSR